MDTLQLTLLCAGHFISGFDYATMHNSVYCSDFRCQLEQIDFEIRYKIYFTTDLKQITSMKVDIASWMNDDEVELTGDIRCAKQKAICLMNKYLACYNIERL